MAFTVLFKTARKSFLDLEGAIQTESLDTVTLTALFEDKNEMRYLASQLLAVVVFGRVAVMNDVRFLSVESSELTSYKRVAEGFLATITLTLESRMEHKTLTIGKATVNTDLSANIKSSQWFACFLYEQPTMRGAYVTLNGVNVELFNMDFGNSVAVFEDGGTGKYQRYKAMYQYPSGRNQRDDRSRGIPAQYPWPFERELTGDPFEISARTEFYYMMIK